MEPSLLLGSKDSGCNACDPHVHEQATLCQGCIHYYQTVGGGEKNIEWLCNHPDASVLICTNHEAYPVLGDGETAFPQQESGESLYQSRHAGQWEVLLIEGRVCTHLGLHGPHDGEHPRLTLLCPICWGWGERDSAVVVGIQFPLGSFSPRIITPRYVVAHRLH